MALSESELEKSEGDLLARRRKVDDYLSGRYNEIQFGPLTVTGHPADGYIVALSPDGDLYEIRVPEENTVESVEEELREAWSDWMDQL